MAFYAFIAAFAFAAAASHGASRAQAPDGRLGGFAETEAEAEAGGAEDAGVAADAGAAGLPGGRPGYLDVPGVTQGEIDAIELVKAARKELVFANERSSEMFVSVDGRVGGTGVIFCEWLTGFFGIRFRPEVLERGEAPEALDDGSADFTTDMAPAPERKADYFMTSAVFERPIQYMRIPGAMPFQEILNNRPLRYAYLRGSPAFPAARESVAGPYVAVSVKDFREAWKRLRAGEADAFVAGAPERAGFDPYGEVAAETVLPMVTSEGAVAARKPELAAFVGVLEKGLQAGGRAPFQEISRLGRRDYARARLLASLTRSELEWVKNRLDGGMPVFAGLEYDNYPASFYNEREGEFQGVAVDILKEISDLTGLDIRGGHDGPVPWAESLAALESGEIAVLSELVRTPEREGRYLWTDAPYMADRYAFLSLSGFPDVGIADVPELRVGLSSGTAAAELFRSWFPGHRRSVTYRDNIEPYGGLERGEIDLVMGTRNELLAMTNYMERPFFKVNFTVEEMSYDSYFGISPREPLFGSVVSKAQKLVDVPEIVARWRVRVFDYRGALARARMPFMAAGLGLLALVIMLLAVMFARSRRSGRVLEEAVSRRTEELSRQIALSEQASRAKSEFLARTSHEIRTPMNAIIGFSELARRTHGQPKCLEYIDGIRSAGGNLLTIINDILDFSKIESGSLNLVPARYGTARLLNDALTLIRARLGEKPVRLKLAVSPDIPAHMTGDYGRIRQILLNLLSNSVKYTHRGHIRLAVNAVRAGEGRAELRIEVKDTGVGIRGEDLDKLFGEFIRLDEKRNTGVEGTGLGLAITRRLCRAMGGDASAESVYGQGSTFRARVVQEAGDWTPMGPLEEEPGDRGAPRPASFSAPGAHVLVADDYASNLMVAEGLLLPYGMSLSFASGGLEAVGLARERRFDLVLMDHLMPEMDGVEALKAIKELPGGREVPVAALTANAAFAMRVSYLELGFDDYLAKPLDPEALDRLLVRWIPLSLRRPAPAPGTYPGGAAGSSFDGPLVRPARGWAGLAALEGVDVKLGAARAGGTARYAKALEAFRKDALEFCDALAGAPGACGGEAFAAKVHSVKSACGNIGAVPLSLRAAALEKAGREGNLPFIEKRLGAFKESLAALAGALTDLDPAVHLASLEPEFLGGERGGEGSPETGSPEAGV
jgi:signal transduction histidine kinase/CheY-like chemotaxis protein